MCDFRFYLLHFIQILLWGQKPHFLLFWFGFFFSYSALHCTIKMLGKHELIYLTHMSYGVLLGLSRAGVMHEKISVKAFTTMTCPAWCLTAWLTQPPLKWIYPDWDRDLIGSNLLSIPSPEHSAVPGISSPFRQWCLTFNINK